jgi:hypothetical protein
VTLQRHCRIRSYLTTARSHGRHPLAAIRDALNGTCWMPPTQHDQLTQAPLTGYRPGDNQIKPNSPAHCRNRLPDALQNAGLAWHLAPAMTGARDQAAEHSVRTGKQVGPKFSQ